MLHDSSGMLLSCIKGLDTACALRWSSDDATPVPQDSGVAKQIFTILLTWPHQEHDGLAAMAAETDASSATWLLVVPAATDCQPC